MLHPDYPYTPKLVSVMTSMIANGEYDSVLASRIQGRGALKGGMPLCKYISNRGLTCIENMLIQEDAEISHRLSGPEPPLLERLPVKFGFRVLGTALDFGPERWGLAKPEFLAYSPAEKLQPGQLEPHTRPFSSNRD